MKLINSTVQFSLLVPIQTDPTGAQAREIRLRIPVPFLPRIDEVVRFRSSMTGVLPARFQVKSVEHDPRAGDGRVLPAAAEVKAVLLSAFPWGTLPASVERADEFLSNILALWPWGDHPIVVLRTDGSVDVGPNSNNLIGTVELPE